MKILTLFGLQLFLHLFHGFTVVIGRPNNGVPQTLKSVIVKDVRSPPQHNGEYSYEIVLNDGTLIKQAGTLAEMASKFDPDFQPFLVISGEYSYISPDGKEHHVTYVADKNGYRPIIDGSVIGQTSVSTPVSFIPTLPPVGNLTQEKLEPLKTISSSLFSSPSRFF